jgi:asparagine synthase (glutamine-hydrolysing)
LGCGRLSIIDLSTGHQPIHNEDETVWLVFNGEIYNYRELRAELEGHGHRFYTSSDTETIVHAYEQWGEDVFRRLRGMFGIALWDRRNRTLLLGRDRSGMKPLHYAERGGRLYFGPRSSRSSAPVPLTARSISALDHYLSFLYVPRDRSIFKGVRKLPPGHLLRWQDGRVHVRPYWQIAATETFVGSWTRRPRNCARAGRRRPLAHGQRRAARRVPLGRRRLEHRRRLMAEASERPVQTFSIGFDDPRYDELEHARDRGPALRHRPPRVRRPARRPVDPRPADRHFDEPFADSSAIPTWYVSEIAGGT